jgi:hypothetical protein
MIIVGCDYHPAFNKSHMWIAKQENCKRGDSGTAQKRRRSTAIWRSEESECAWAWKPVDRHAGLNDCWRS